MVVEITDDMWKFGELDTYNFRFGVIQWIRREAAPEVTTAEWLQYFIDMCDKRENGLY